MGTRDRRGAGRDGVGGKPTAEFCRGPQVGARTPPLAVPDTVQRLCGSCAEALEQSGYPPAKAKPDLGYAERIQQAQSMATAGHAPAAIAKQIGVSRSSVAR